MSPALLLLVALPARAVDPEEAARFSLEVGGSGLAGPVTGEPEASRGGPATAAGPEIHLGFARGPWRPSAGLRFALTSPARAPVLLVEGEPVSYAAHELDLVLGLTAAPWWRLLVRGEVFLTSVVPSSSGPQDLLGVDYSAHATERPAGAGIRLAAGLLYRPVAFGLAAEYLSWSTEIEVERTVVVWPLYEDVTDSGRFAFSGRGVRFGTWVAFRFWG